MYQRRGGVLALSLLLCAMAPGLTAQTPQTRPTFRASTDVVPLTVTVLDKSGNPVTNLKASDFTILENRQPREILNFFTQEFTAAPEAAALTPGTLARVPPTRGVAPETRRSFVIVLGYGRIQYPVKAVDGAIAFVRDHLLPQDVVAVLAFDRATDFTTDHAQIVRMLERYRQEHERLVFEFEEWLQRRYTPDDSTPKPIRDDIDAVFTGIPTPRIRKLGPSWSDHGQADGTMRESVPMLMGLDAALNPGRGTLESGPTLQDFETEAGYSHLALEQAMLHSSVLKGYAGIEYLRYLEGEKHMLYLGPDGLVPAYGHDETDKTDDARFARRLNDARITLDMIRTTGPPQAKFGPPSAWGMTDLVNILGFQHVAELNGGTYTGVTYADKALANIDRASRFSYLLGYAPVNPSLDGKYRNVEVRVNRPDLVVRYRHGYFASEQPEPLRLSQLMTTARLESAMVARGAGSKDIKVEATATLMPRLGVVAQLRVAVHIDATRLSLPTAGSTDIAKIQLRVYVGDDKEALVGDSSEELHITIADADARAALLRDGISRVIHIPLNGTPKYIKVVVYDPTADLMGTSVERIGAPSSSGASRTTGTPGPRNHASHRPRS
jgi:VWFA-related protein